MSYEQPIQQIEPVQNPPKQVSLETIKRRLKKLVPQEFPVLINHGELYWFHSPRKCTTMSNTLEFLQNLREFFSLDLDKKQLDKYYEIHKHFYDCGNGDGIVTYYEGSYYMGAASGTMFFGTGLDHNEMIAKIDDYIAKYHN